MLPQQNEGQKKLDTEKSRNT